jgi:sphingomyelin phosphodiesterase
MAYGGYYQARARPGLRVISLNSNYFTSDNFWLLANRTAAEDQLNWYADVLRQASELGEKAIILAHHPLLSWEVSFAQPFLNITEMYSTVVLNLFAGHTHNNQYETTRSAANPAKALHVMYVGGSIVPFTDINPGYMQYVYSRDQIASGTATQLVEEAMGYWMVLPEANANNDTTTQWSTLRYNMTAALGVSGLDAQSLSDLAPSYLSNPQLLSSYLNAKYKGVTQGGADSAQLVRCSTASNTESDFHACMHAQGLQEKRIQSLMEVEEGNC